MMTTVMESESNGPKSGLDDQHCRGSDEKTRRHPRWTREETLSLIRAKEIAERNPPQRGRRVSCVRPDGTEPKWVMISASCKQMEVDRGPAQCRKRWSNLIGDFKKVKAWEDNNKLKDMSESFWLMRNDLRKERKLPVSFDREVFKVLEGRGVGFLGLDVSPLPIQAVAGSEDQDDVEEGEEEEEEAEDEPENESKEMIEDVEVEDVTVSEIRGGGVAEEVIGSGGKLEEEKTDINNVNGIANGNVNERIDKEVCSPEPISEQHHQAFKNQKTYPSQAASMVRQSWPGISCWNSQGREKRRRPSTDGNQAADKEAQVMRVLETNNKMLHDQLDVHNKNCQLDREQKKENNDALVAALGKLTDAIAKIAEKL